jgi:hypothetical protein
VFVDKDSFERRQMMAVERERVPIGHCYYGKQESYPVATKRDFVKRQEERPAKVTAGSRDNEARQIICEKYCKQAFVRL